jgi:hypothetical protein
MSVERPAALFEAGNALSQRGPCSFQGGVHDKQFGLVILQRRLNNLSMSFANDPQEPLCACATLVLQSAAHRRVT